MDSELLMHRRLKSVRYQCDVKPEIAMAGPAMSLKPSNYVVLNHYHKNHGSREGSLAYISFTFRTGDALDEACIKTFVENLPWELFRMKGPARFRDRTIWGNYVGGKNEWTVWSDIEETCLVCAVS